MGEAARCCNTKRNVACDVSLLSQLNSIVTPTLPVGGAPYRAVLAQVVVQNNAGSILRVQLMEKCHHGRHVIGRVFIASHKGSGRVKAQERGPHLFTEGGQVLHGS